MNPGPFWRIYVVVCVGATAILSGIALYRVFESLVQP